VPARPHGRRREASQVKETAVPIRRVLLWCTLTLLPGGCSHRLAAERDEPTVRTKGGDSATARIPVLIAKGQFTEAEELIARFLAGGLISREAATRLREEIRQRRQQPSPQPEPERFPPVEPRVAPEDDPSGGRRTCEAEFPDHPVCHELPEDYSYHSVQQALSAMKQRLGVKNLVLHGQAATETGPCPIIGKHYNVRNDGGRVGSIVCCPCCVNMAAGPLLWSKCRIVW
jgi:hypothetical protein